MVDALSEAAESGLVVSDGGSGKGRHGAFGRLTAFQLLGSGAELVPLYFYFLHSIALDIH
jgi:hypothetical protein